jgi:hypothetical protein
MTSRGWRGSATSHTLKGAFEHLALRVEVEVEGAVDDP